MGRRADKFRFKSGVNTLQGYGWGKGPAVVFIHGWAGRGLQCHSHVEALVAAGFSVYAFDHVGHGRSTGKTSNYFEFSNGMAAFMEHLAGSEIHAVVAHSLGGAAAINHLWKTGLSVKTILIAPALSIRQTLARTFSRYGVPARVYTAVLNTLGRETGHDLGREDPVDLIRMISSDLFIVHDTRDRAVPYEDSWQAGLTRSNIRLFTTRGLGHIRILEDRAMQGEFLRMISRKDSKKRGDAKLPLPIKRRQSPSQLNRW
ncbi:MAG: lysophospholipase [Desulfobacterales bacterium]|nr:lysophospholipase [Desulfobacterales bacterium]